MCVIIFVRGVVAFPQVSNAAPCVDLDADPPTLRVERSPATQPLRHDPFAAQDPHQPPGRGTPPGLRRRPAPPTPDTGRRPVERRTALAPDGLLFTTDIGTPLDPSNVRRRHQHIADRAGLDHLHPHLLRHAAARLLSAAGVPLEENSDLLGHGSITVTDEVHRHPLSPVRSGHLDAIADLTKTPTVGEHMG